MIRLAVIGGAAAGKSALCNVLFGTAFSVDARVTGEALEAVVRWRGRELRVIEGAAARADAYLLVCDKDLTESEYRSASRVGRPLGVALNKADTFNASQRRQLLAAIRRRLRGVVADERVAACAADPVRVVFRDGEAVYVPAVPAVRDVAEVVEAVVAEAERSVRVKAREIAERYLGGN